MDHIRREGSDTVLVDDLVLSNMSSLCGCGMMDVGYVARLGQSDDDPIDPLSSIEDPGSHCMQEKILIARAKRVLRQHVDTRRWAARLGTIEGG